MNILISCVIASVFVILFQVVKSFAHKLNLSRKLPGPKGLPILGLALELTNKTPTEFLQTIIKYIGEYGNQLFVWLGPEPFYFTTNVKDVEAILSDPRMSIKSKDYHFMQPWLGTGLLTSFGDKWYQRRKIITPTFHFKILEQFVEVFDRQTDILIEKLEKHNSSGVFDIFPHVSLCALDVICESAMGVGINAQDEGDSEYIRAVTEISEIIHCRTYNLLHRFDILFKLTPTYRKQKKILKILHGFTDKVIIERREKLLESNNDIGKQPEISDDAFGSKKKVAFLDVLLQSTIDGKPLSNLDIREEVDTFMFEGHDTTTSGIAFSLYYIAKNPEVQAKVFEEIRNVIGDDLRKPVNLQDLNELNYLELVIKESLRLHPSVPIFCRRVPEEMEINGQIFPKDTSIIIGAYFMGRDPSIWQDAEKFIPERFDVVKSAEKFNPYGYVPFSAGQRNCVGQKFAMLELKSTISKVLRHYKISTPKDYEPDDVLELIIKSKNGVLIETERRLYQ